MYYEVDIEESLQEKKITKLKAALSEIGLDYARKYFLIAPDIRKPQGVWRFEWVGSTTKEQFDKANELLEAILNKG